LREEPGWRHVPIFCTIVIAPVCYMTDTVSIILLILIDFLLLLFKGPIMMDPDTQAVSIDWSGEGKVSGGDTGGGNTDPASGGNQTPYNFEQNGTKMGKALKDLIKPSEKIVLEVDENGYIK